MSDDSLSGFALPPQHDRYSVLLRGLKDRLLTEPDFYSGAFFTALFQYAITYGESLVLSGTVNRRALEQMKGWLARQVMEASRRVESEQTN